MAKFGRTSANNLSTCHRDLQILCEAMIVNYDFSVVFGHRSMAIQNALFKKGRKLKPDALGDKREDYIIVNRAQVVTYRGFEKPSNHNKFPSLAVDIIPYPSGWSNANKIYELAGFAKATYLELKAVGAIESEMTFGSDWKNPADPPHIEIRS